VGRGRSGVVGVIPRERRAALDPWLHRAARGRLIELTSEVKEGIPGGSMKGFGKNLPVEPSRVGHICCISHKRLEGHPVCDSSPTGS
jgi:hypothetical protein